MSQIAATSAVLVRQKAVEHLVAAVADADEAEANAVVGAEDARRRGGGQRDGGRGLAELATSGTGHGMSLPFSRDPKGSAKPALPFGSRLNNAVMMPSVF